MNTTTLSAPQAHSSQAIVRFPQSLPSQLVAMTPQAAVSAILDLFDAGAIPADIAENWLVTIENISN